VRDVVRRWFYLGQAWELKAPPTSARGSISVLWRGQLSNWRQTIAKLYFLLCHTAGLICHIHNNKITRSDVFYFGATEGAMVIAKELAAPTKPARSSGR
jgi:hypothetical protein